MCKVEHVRLSLHEQDRMCAGIMFECMFKFILNLKSRLFCKYFKNTFRETQFSNVGAPHDACSYSVLLGMQF